MPRAYVSLMDNDAVRFRMIHSALQLLQAWVDGSAFARATRRFTVFAQNFDSFLAEHIKGLFNGPFTNGLEAAVKVSQEHCLESIIIAGLNSIMALSRAIQEGISRKSLSDHELVAIDDLLNEIYTTFDAETVVGIRSTLPFKAAVPYFIAFREFIRRCENAVNGLSFGRIDLELTDVNEWMQASAGVLQLAIDTSESWLSDQEWTYSHAEVERFASDLNRRLNNFVYTVDETTPIDITANSSHEMRNIIIAIRRGKTTNMGHYYEQLQGLPVHDIVLEEVVAI